MPFIEQIGLSGSAEDEEFIKLIDKTYVMQIRHADDLFDELRKNPPPHFSLRLPKRINLDISATNFGEKRAAFLSKGRPDDRRQFDLLGFLNIDFGASIDWHYEPLREHSR